MDLKAVKASTNSISKGGLITGVPRSGTTLCCHLLNQQNNVVALHEPINPSEIEVNQSTILSLVRAKYVEYERALYYGMEFEHGEQSGLEIDNPVGSNMVDGKREVIAKRGNIVVSKYIGQNIQLFVKQNAFFTAYLDSLVKHFKVICIVRNPVDVFLSWWTVNLPVSKGRLPAGENNNIGLRQALSLEVNEFKRQVIIYQWFVKAFVSSQAPIVRYEDIIKTNGQTLFDATAVTQTAPQALTLKNRRHDSNILLKLKTTQRSFIEMDCSGLYEQDEIAMRLDSLLGKSV